MDYRRRLNFETLIYWKGKDSKRTKSTPNAMSTCPFCSMPMCSSNLRFSKMNMCICRGSITRFLRKIFPPWKQHKWSKQYKKSKLDYPLRQNWTNFKEDSSFWKNASPIQLFGESTYQSLQWYSGKIFLCVQWTQWYLIPYFISLKVPIIFTSLK